MTSPVALSSLSAVRPAWAVLIEAIESLSAARTLERVIEIVRLAAREVSGADGVTFVLRDGDRCHYVDENAIGPLWKGQKFPMSACISGWAMLNKRSAVIPDIYVDPRIPHDAYRPTFVKSLLMVPVRVEDPLAAIGAYWATHHQPDDDEIALLESLARAAATSIANVSLEASLRAAAETAAAQAAEIGNAYEALQHEMARRLLVEEQLRQSQKMEAIGQLTGGMAHDFNNLLGVVIGNLDMLADARPDDADVGEFAGPALEASLKGAELIRHLLAFARRQPLQPQRVDANNLVRQMAELMQRTLGEQIEIALDLAADTWPVVVDPAQLETLRGDQPPVKASLFAQGAGALPQALSGYPSLASKVHATDSAVSGALADWFSGFYAAEADPAHAARMQLPAGAVLVNRAGHHFTGHTLSFHAPDTSDAGLLARQGEIEALEARSPELEARLTGAHDALASLEGDLAERQAALEILRGGHAVAAVLGEEIRPFLEPVVINAVGVIVDQVLDLPLCAFPVHRPPSTQLRPPSGSASRSRSPGWRPRWHAILRSAPRHDRPSREPSSRRRRCGWRAGPSRRCRSP